ncbi:MAG: suppressor of fused domain protein [Pseudomonadota bacterium]
MEKHIGAIERIYQEPAGRDFPLELLHVAPQTKRPFHVFVTRGVSNRAMRVPREMEEFARAELLLALPAAWPVAGEANENHDWPLQWLRRIGRLPYEFDTWIGWGHSIPNGDPPAPIADTGFAGVCLAPPYWLKPEFFQLKTALGETVCFYDLVPVYADELALKLNEGFGELEKCFEKAATGFILDVNRKSVAPQHGQLGH